MQFRIHEDTIDITCTIQECYWLSVGNAIYGTPNPRGRIVTVYLNSRPQFLSDRIVATVDDFLEVEGWDLLGDYDPDDPTLEDQITITVKRDG